MNPPTTRREPTLMGPGPAAVECVVERGQIWEHGGERHLVLSVSPHGPLRCPEFVVALRSIGGRHTQHQTQPAARLCNPDYGWTRLPDPEDEPTDVVPVMALRAKEGA